jgi:pimeloyl-ACP methyl ester carboxylesterase
MIKYINNNSNTTILLLHGLACNILYFNDIVDLFNRKYNIILPELFGHYENSKINFTMEEQIDFISRYCKNNNIKIDIIVAHSMASILAFCLDKVLSNINSIFLLEGNILIEDFEWSSQISNMKEDKFIKYWKKFQKEYPLILKMKLKKKIDLKIYTQHILILEGFGIYQYAKLINNFKINMDIFKESFHKIIYLESSNSNLIFSKKLLSKKYGFKIILIDKASHYMMLDAPSQIVNIINEKQNDN